jgi:hypothetical protein
MTHCRGRQAISEHGAAGYLARRRGIDQEFCCFAAIRPNRIALHGSGNMPEDSVSESSVPLGKWLV